MRLLTRACCCQVQPPRLLARMPAWSRPETHTHPHNTHTRTRAHARARCDLTRRAPPPLRVLCQVALTALSVAICYADRSNISTAIIPMSEQFGWEPSWQGLILSMFFLGYLLTQMLGGGWAGEAGRQQHAPGARLQQAQGGGRGGRGRVVPAGW